MWSRVGLIITEVSEQRVASSGENQRAKESVSSWLRESVGGDTFFRNVGHDATFQKTTFFIAIAVKASNFSSSLFMKDTCTHATNMNIVFSANCNAASLQ
jgi:hypothetical protein